MLYTASAFAAWSLMSSSRSSAGSGNEQQETARVLDWPAGRWIVLAVAAGFLADGVYNVYRGWTKKFRERLDEHEMHGTVRTWAMRSGVVGHIARGVVFAVVGIFLGKAALEYDPNEAVGHRRRAAQAGRRAPRAARCSASSPRASSPTPIYCLVEARYRRI